MSAVLKPAYDLYAQLNELPAHQTGEILNSRLYAHPRPAGPHALASSSLGGEIHGPYQLGKGGPGGWWILDEPEIHFMRNVEVCVPDLAGWRRERMPRIPRGHRFEIVPDWICEVLSPATARLDRVVKRQIYARFGVAYLWLVDPIERTLEAFALRDGFWLVIALHQEDERARIAPFEEMELNLLDLWGEVEETE